MTTRMAPFRQDIPHRVCTNPDCKPEGRHSKDCKRVAGGKPGEFAPKTPWQETCCKRCRMRKHYLSVLKPRRLAQRKSEESTREKPNSIDDSPMA